MTHAPIHISPITMLIATVISWWERRKDHEPEPKPAKFLPDAPIELPHETWDIRIIGGDSFLPPEPLPRRTPGMALVRWRVAAQVEGMMPHTSHRAVETVPRVRCGWTVRVVAA